VRFAPSYDGKYLGDVAFAANGPIYELQKIDVDTAGAFFPWSWAGVVALSGPKHILFGPDDPTIPT
jgi:hypothetical protein